MAVVTKYGTGYKDPAAIRPVASLFAEAQVRAIVSKVAIANGDSSTSVLFIGKLPSNAIIDPNSLVYASAITGLTSLSVGFTGAAAALMSAVDIAAGGSFSMVGAVTAGNLSKQVYQHAGLTVDPGGNLDVFATLGANAGAAGTLEFFLRFLKG